MGADLLTYCFWTTQPETVDFAVARARAQTATFEDARWDGDVVHEECRANGLVPITETEEVTDEAQERAGLSELRRLLAEAVDEVEAAWRGERRDCRKIICGPVTILLTGGMSWGDLPTEASAVFERFDQFGLDAASGFGR